MKKKILIIATVAILLSLMAYGTLAYFNASTTAVNKVTMGNIDVSVIEKQAGENGTEVDFVNDQTIMPGAVVSKIVRVQNDSTNASAWIRAKVEITATDTDNKALSTDNIKLNISSDWTLKDGYYYYKDAVAAGAQTGELFTTVTFDGQKIGNDFQDASIKITVTAEAVQSANNGTIVSDAKGWPNS